MRSKKKKRWSAPLRVLSYLSVAAAAYRLPRRMSLSQIRKITTSGRREGRRSLAAYGARARGVRGPFRACEGLRLARGSGCHASRVDARSRAHPGAAMALALVFPFMRRSARPWVGKPADRLQTDGILPKPDDGGSEGEGCMKRKPSIRNLETVSLEEAMAYLDYANGDELNAACALAWDRNRLDGSGAAPDDAEVHHALFLLCRARGARPPSYDEMRVERRRRVAA